MDKYTLEFIDDRLNAGVSPQGTLHVVLGADSVSVLSAGPSGEVTALRSWTFPAAGQSFEAVEWDLRRLLRDEAPLNLPFSQVHCALFHPNATLVPRRLFQHNALPGYFKLLLPASDYTFGYDEMPEFDAYLVHATEPGWLKLCAEFFPRARQRHLAVPLLRYFRDMPGGGEHRVLANFRHQIVQVAVFERQNLLFYNTFEFLAASDLLYFILLVYDQFRLSPEEIPLQVAGNLLRDSELYRMLFRFIRDIRFAESPALYRIPPSVEVLPGHCHLDLFCLKNL